MSEVCQDNTNSKDLRQMLQGRMLECHLGNTNECTPLSYSSFMTLFVRNCSLSRFRFSALIESLVFGENEFISRAKHQEHNLLEFNSPHAELSRAGVPFPTSPVRIYPGSTWAKFVCFCSETNSSDCSSSY